MEKIISKEDLEDLSLCFVDEFFSIVREVLSKKNKVYVALSGGNSVKPFYENILFLSKFLTKDLWERVYFCFADERIVPLDSPDSNYNLVKEIFFNVLLEQGLIEENQIISIDPNSKDVVEDYNKKVPRVDIAILASGEDGHTASLFPKHDSIKNEDKKYVLVEKSPKPPENRISMSKNMILDCKLVFLLFIGSKKKEAYKIFRKGDPIVSECPVLLTKDCEELRVFTDLRY
jgi:6-phosphogluconolactonase